MRRPEGLIALGFGAGLAPRAPGTFGTAVAVPLYLVMAPWPLWVYLAGLVLITGVGIWVCDRVAGDLGVHDHPAIVWDEIAGFLVTMTASPAGLIWVALGFVLFRLFDIAKPGPIGFLDRRLRGGLGIMVDDLAAGAAAWLVLQAIALAARG
jgi:phosphatidylglycerophosphatase A